MIQTTTLNCGTTVVMEKIPHVQSAALGIWVRTGAVDEPSNLAGVSHYIEHMLFKGTERRTAKDLASDVDKIGGQMNAFTGKEATCYYIKTLSAHIEEAAEILLDMLVNSQFDKVEMGKERSVICEEIKMIRDTPDDDAHDTACELVFKGNPLANSIVGTPSSLGRITQNAIKAYLRKEYTRDHLVIAIAGNFNEETICRIFEGQLGSLAGSKAQPAHEPVRCAPSFKVKVKDIEQTHICMAVRGIALEDSRYYAMGLLTDILGGSMSSRLFQNIREQKGLAYSVYAISSSFSNDGYFNIYAGVAHEKAADAIRAVKQELRALEQGGVTAEELAMAKEQMKSSYIFGQENVNGRMFSIGKNMVVSRKIHTQEEVMEEIDRVSMEDIEEAAVMVCNMKEYCGAAVTNKKFPLRAMMED